MEDRGLADVLAEYVAELRDKGDKNTVHIVEAPDAACKKGTGLFGPPPEIITDKLMKYMEIDMVCQYEGRVFLVRIRG